MPTVPWEHGSAHLTLLAFRQHLVDAGICRAPNTAGDAPPMFLEPTDGVPAPGEGSGNAVGPTLVLGAFLTTAIAPAAWGDGFSDRQIVDVWFRSESNGSWRGPAAASAVAEQFAPAPYGARTNWQMGDLTVIESRIWRPLQPIGSDRQGSTRTLGLYIETYRET